MSNAHRGTPKNIVLLSDGTGNSSAKLMKTNVWRMYEAIDLTKGDQVACYDNGVGTSSFKPFAVLGGGLGWGLKRNVRHLYTYACSHYVDASDVREADRLFGFGFSRGAFTMRVLMGLIESQGLITGVKGQELDRLAKWAYREYRRKFNATRGLVTPLRKLRDVVLRTWERLRGLPPYSQATRVTPPVAFLGIWDTVDAYGLPMDEMTRGWDQWVWPLSMCERRRPKNVEKICHAVALDDERHTFHPVLIDESTPDLVNTSQTDPVDHTDQEKVTQVWFAGMHSNVGGGYPDDSLAHVSLLWMAEEAAKQKLRLHQHMIDLWIARADPNGPASDSRRGLGAYYRYNPRSIKKLTNDRFADVTIKRPKIHESVFQRIVGGRDDYAPIVLPEQYDIVTSGGALATTNAYEHPTQSNARCAMQERVWNDVWIRRGLYFSTVGLTAVLLLAPSFLETLDLPDPASGTLKAAIHLVGDFLPGTLQPITGFWEGHPVIFAVLVSTIAILFHLSTMKQRAIANGMRTIWDGILRHGHRDVPPVPEPSDTIYRFRSNARYRNTVEYVSQHVFPFVFGVAALGIVVLNVAGVANRAAFTAYSLAGKTCVPLSKESGTDSTKWADIKVPGEAVCHPANVWLERGHTYEVSIALSPDWDDKGHRGGLTGIPSSESPAYVAFLPFRRVLRESWFVPIARIGSRSPEYHSLTTEKTSITPRRDGHLYIFVNDAVGLVPWYDYFYKNNHGTATISVKEVSAPSPEIGGAEPVRIAER